jgi:hypothetical protein
VANNLCHAAQSEVTLARPDFCIFEQDISDSPAKLIGSGEDVEVTIYAQSLAELPSFSSDLGPEQPGVLMHVHVER